MKGNPVDLFREFPYNNFILTAEAAEAFRRTKMHFCIVPRTENPYPEFRDRIRNRTAGANGNQK